jgi:GST-like protein
MIHAYTWPTPNGHKLHIMLEECGLAYEVHPIDIGEGAQFDPEFLKFSPNNKMPAIIDDEGPGGEAISIFESGAILYYLAQKTGRFMPSLTADPRGHYATMEWLMFQMGGIGPMMGQNNHFRAYAPEKIPYAIERYGNEVKRLFGVVDRRLGAHPWIAGADYTIADMAAFPWLRNHERQGVPIADFPNVGRWLATIEARPAVQRGLAVLKESRRQGPPEGKAWEMLFGKAQYERR